MDDVTIVIVWPRPEDYPRFFEICRIEDYPPTYIEFVQQALERMAAHGVDADRIKKVHVDPDEMLEWCMRHHGKIDEKTRSLFAMFKFRSSHGKGANAIN